MPAADSADPAPAPAAPSAADPAAAPAAAARPPSPPSPRTPAVEPPYHPPAPPGSQKTLLGEPVVTRVPGRTYAEPQFAWSEIWIPIRDDSLIDLSPSACQLCDHYWFGNMAFAKSKQLLEEHGITHILSLTRQRVPEEVRSAFNWKQIQVSDTPQTSIAHTFEAAFGHIEAAKEAGGKVFVHCRAGVSRVSCVTIAYAMKSQKIKLREAYLMVKRARPVANPNKGFLAQLIEFEKWLFRLQDPTPGFGIDMAQLPYAVWERAEHLGLNNPIPPMDACHATEAAVKEAYRQKYGMENPYRTLDAGLGGKMDLHCVHLYPVHDFDIVDWAIRSVLAPHQNTGPKPRWLSN
eukprot:TRINITY_DN675_c0_g2_i1.p1 TRINITY_DN675_c0_g2~~TRINITY_DN675_c0_g2_i1.p1  ORF type:complete len:378 (+),score=118.33 TRINITY_DN675_c0_g2_i1:90-1136(+)